MVVVSELPSALRLPKRHFNALDLSRLFAAVAVLFWHYLHFTMPPGINRAPANFGTLEPLHGVFAAFYEHGHLAVQYFWIVSGFVFAHVYLGDPAARERFWTARIARLWPLHLLTLGVVAALQALYVARIGSSFVFAPNDITHFLLNLGLAHFWGFQSGMSFNGPSWSLSVEILAYGVFWTLLPMLRERRLGIAAALACGGAFAAIYAPGLGIWPCLGYFFGGTAAYFVLLRGWHLGWLLPLTAATGLALAFRFERDPQTIFPYGALWVVALFALALAVDWFDRGDRLAFGRKLGDASYGTYLWHFPIQLTIVLVLDRLPGGRALSQHWEVLTIYLIAALAAGFASHRWIERPAQRAVLSAAERFAKSRRASPRRARSYPEPALCVPAIQPPPSTRSPA